ARIATALTAKERQLWHREDPNNRATPQQRMADALAELISEPTNDSRSVATDLLVIADFDVLKQQLENPRLVDGSPIPITELHKLALEANLLPSIFDTKTQDMWLGRRVRTATEAQRIALIARDKHCIGCGANPLWCQAHHIIWWSHNGPTNLENLVLVCNDCHHKIHDDGWQVHKHPDTGKYQLKPPTQPTTRPTENPLSDPSGERSLVSSNEPSTHQPSDHPTASMNKPIRNTLDEPPTHQPSKHPTASMDKSARNSSGERSAVSSGEVLTISTDRADRDRTRADSGQPVAGDGTESTVQNARGHAHDKQAQRKNQTTSHTEQQHPAARTTGHDPVDGIDTS
nr:HNH endonuclease [Acidimicrobiia bacterium]